jgi:hypothetical protein
MVRLRPGRIRDERAFQEMSARFGRRARVSGFVFDESVTAVTAIAPVPTEESSCVPPTPPAAPPG